VRGPILEYFQTGQRKTEPAPHVDDLVGRLFAGGIKTFCRKHALETTSIDLVGTHSEASEPSHRYANAEGAKQHRVRWNTIVAAETGISTAFDFTIIERAVVRPYIRPVAYVDRIFLRHPTKFRVCLNIDEISNLSFIPTYGDDGARATISRDCGPGNLLIDYAVRYCTANDHFEDHDGKMGSLGKVNQDIVDRFLDSHDYLRQPPPLNIATEMFGDHEAQQLIDECLYNSMSEEDTLATITRITAQNILKQYQRLLQIYFPQGQKVDELFICGPGVKNSNIVDYLESELPESVITKPLHDIGIPGDAHEAVCYTHLALEAVLNQATHSTDTIVTPSSAYSNTDAVRARVVPGRRWNELLSHMKEFSGGQQIHVALDVRIMGSLETAVQGMDIHS
jgi:1,6-anhydro-N-acetylmuramate kinase